VQSSENMIINCEVDVASSKMPSKYFPGEKIVSTRSEKGDNSAEIRIQDIPNTAKSVSSAMKKPSSFLQLMVVTIFGASEIVY